MFLTQKELHFVPYLKPPPLPITTWRCTICVLLTYCKQIALLECKQQENSQSLLSPHSLEWCLAHNELWLKLPVSHLPSMLPFFLSYRVTALSGPAVVLSYVTTATASLINRSGQRGLSRSHGVGLLEKHTEGVSLFKEVMPFHSWPVLLPAICKVIAGAATAMVCPWGKLTFRNHSRRDLSLWYQV